MGSSRRMGRRRRREPSGAPVAAPGRRVRVAIRGCAPGTGMPSGDVHRGRGRHRTMSTGCAGATGWGHREDERRQTTGVGGPGAVGSTAPVGRVPPGTNTGVRCPPGRRERGLGPSASAGVRRGWAVRPGVRRGRTVRRRRPRGPGNAGGVTSEARAPSRSPDTTYWDTAYRPPESLGQGAEGPGRTGSTGPAPTASRRPAVNRPAAPRSAPADGHRRPVAVRRIEFAAAPRDTARPPPTRSPTPSWNTAPAPTRPARVGKLPVIRR